MRIRLSTVYVVLYVFLASIFAACTTEPAANSTSEAREQTIGHRGGKLIYRVTSPIKTLNYLMSDDEPSVLVTLFLLNGRLIEMDHDTQRYLPALAESYSAADGKTVDVVLRDGLKFSDGHALTSADIVFTLQAIYDKRTASPIFRDAMLINGKEIQTKVIDDRRFQFVFPESVASVENYLENLAVLPKHILDPDLQSGKLAESQKITADPATIITSGPFVVDTVQAGERVSLKRNPNYWKKDTQGIQLPYLDNLVIETVKDPNDTLARLQQGTLSVADRIRTSDYASLKPSGGSVQTFDAGPGLMTDHLWFNLNPAKLNGESLESGPKFKWFSERRFRTAVAHAIDRNSIATNTLQGLATPLFGFVPAGNRAWLDPNLPRTEYDPARAKSLLSEAGFVFKRAGETDELYDKDGNRVEFTIIVRTENEPRKLMAAIVQEDLAKLGMAVQVAPIETAGVQERWNKSFDYDAILDGLSLTALDPSSFAGLLLSSAAVHQWRPKQGKPATDWEAKIDELFGRQAQEIDAEKRKQIFFQIQSVMADEMPIIPIVSRHIVSAGDSKIGNHSPSSVMPFSMWNADRLYIRN
jgi:peptide/nickel transport system substrate-binding protein